MNTTVQFLKGALVVAVLQLLSGHAFAGSDDYGSGDRQVVDFDGNGQVNVDDLNLLLTLGPLAKGAELGPDVPRVFDLNRDQVLDMLDVALWLSDAAAVNGMSLPYGVGDGNLDGVVDSWDYKLWNDAKFSPSLDWDHGDFNCDGMVDVSDFNLWNSHRDHSLASLGAVPEPTSLTTIGWAAAMLVAGRLDARVGEADGPQSLFRECVDKEPIDVAEYLPLQVIVNR